MSAAAEQALAEGLAQHQAGAPDAAALAYRRALELEPRLPGAALGLAMLLLEAGGQAEAGLLMEGLVARHPQAALPRALLGQAWLLQGRWTEAEPQLRQALAADPGLAATHVQLGQCLDRRGALDQALAQYRLASALAPDAPQVATSLATTYQRLGRYDEAEACLRAALALAPTDLPARYNLAMLLLLLGRLEEGWAGRELRWQAAGIRPRAFAEPVWNGQPLQGRSILLHSAQEGLGDAIMALRYAPLLQALGARVLVQCDPALTELFTTCPWVDQVVAEGQPLPGFHCQAQLMSLPGLFGTRLDSIPCPIPYLHAPSAPANPSQRRCAQRLTRPARLRVGLVHAGNPRHPNDDRRSIAPAELAALAGLGPELAFFSLQQHRQPALPPLPEALNAVDLGDLLGDFGDTARALAHLDLVISVDTAVAHLAGAMGKPVLLLLPREPEWRWLLERGDSPWYPSFQLFRQAPAESWGQLLARVKAALLERLGGTC